MGFSLEAEEGVEEGIRRVALTQTDRALAELDDESLNVHETIHQVRKRCKKIRGLLRLVRPSLGKTYERENAQFRDTARLISGARDVTAMIEAYDALLDRHQGPVDRRAFAPIRRRLSASQKELTADEAYLQSQLQTVHQALTAARQRVDGWKLKAGGYKSVREGLLMTYARGMDQRKIARNKPTDEHLHDWRKRVKYHWHHVRLLRNSWSAILKPRCHELKRLSDLLGDDHDLALFASTLAADKENYGKIQALPLFHAMIRERRGELQSEAQRLGRLVYAESPEMLGERFKVYWKTWRQ